MKRTPLHRKTPLRAKSSLNAHTVLQNATTGTARKAFKRIPVPISPAERNARRVIPIRSEGRCEIDGINLATDLHHRQLRSQGGSWAVSNMLHLCRTCHGRVTSPVGAERELCVANGWIVASYRDAAQVQAVLHEWGPMYLRDDGSIQYAKEAA